MLKNLTKIRASVFLARKKVIKRNCKICRFPSSSNKKELAKDSTYLPQKIRNDLRPYELLDSTTKSFAPRWTRVNRMIFEQLMRSTKTVRLYLYPTVLARKRTFK